MEKILAQRFSFCDFSQIVGFPNALPDRDIWENFLPEFHAKSSEEPAEHLLDFHGVIDRLNITHEDVQIKLFRYSLKGVALDWCRSLPTASIHSLKGFHTAFHSFCKDYFPSECLYENCCEEFSSLHESSAGPEDHVYDEAFTVEESICYENIEVLNDINFVSPRIEASDIISDASVLLDAHKDQHASCENYEFIEQMWSIVDGSPGYRVEADVPSSPAYDDEDLPIFKEEMVVEEDSSLFLQGVFHDIFLPRIKENPMDPIYDDYRSDPWESYGEQEEDQKRVQFTACTEVTEQQFEEHNLPVVPIYDEYESDPGESQEEEPEEPEELFALCPELVSEQPLPESFQSTSVVHPPMLTIDIQPHIHNCVAEEAACRQFSFSTGPMSL
jgi:hypothetical protein